MRVIQQQYPKSIHPSNVYVGVWVFDQVDIWSSDKCHCDQVRIQSSDKMDAKVAKHPIVTKLTFGHLTNAIVTKFVLSHLTRWMPRWPNMQL